jgi:signal transduction histidine kinase
MGKAELLSILILFNIVIVVFIAGIAMYIKQYKRKKNLHENEMKMNNELHKQELLSTQLEMQQQTMQYIGREIHDSVGQKLTLASLYTQQLAYENKAPQINDRIENISHIINESLTELRQLSKSLTDDGIAENTITALLQLECDKVNGTKICKANFISDLPNTILSYQTKSIMVRIVQEFLQNSIKHSGCKNINVSLSEHENTILLGLKDDGKGFEPKKISGNGIGLNNMKIRTELIGGRFNFESSIGTGTKLNIEIPLPKQL